MSFKCFSDTWRALQADRRKGRGRLHISQHGVITGDLGEVVFQDGHGAGESHMAASAEQGDAGEAEDRGHQRRVGHPA